MADKLSRKAIKAIRSGALEKIAKDNDTRREAAKKNLPASRRASDTRQF